MNKLSSLFTLLFFFSSSFIYSQSIHFCDADALEQQHRQQDTQRHDKEYNAYIHSVNQWRSRNANYQFENKLLQNNGTPLQGGPTCPDASHIIPVVVHVVHSSGLAVGQGNNISIAQINNAIEVLNNAYGNTNGQGVNTGWFFCLAQSKADGTTTTGIERHPSYLTDHLRHKQTDSLFSLAAGHYPSQNYLNIFVVNNILDSNGIDSNVQGFASYPWGAGKKAIAITHEFFGNYATTGAPLHTQSKGLVLVHEMGHYFGVKHPFDAGCQGKNANDCATKGDLCCDVPDHDFKEWNCNSTLIPCSSPLQNVQKENFMEYTPENCRTLFTHDQTGIMLYSLQTFRNQLYYEKIIKLD